MTDAKKIKRDWKARVGQRFKDRVADMGMDMNEFAKAFWRVLKFPTQKAAVTALYARETPDVYYAVRFGVEFGLHLEYVLCERDDLDNCIDPHGRYSDKTFMQPKVTPSASKK